MSECVFVFVFPSLPGASLVAQMVRNLPAMQETQVQYLCWEDPLEKGMATHTSIPAWRIPWTKKPGGLQTTGLLKSQTRLSDYHFHSPCLEYHPSLSSNGLRVRKPIENSRFRKVGPCRENVLKHPEPPGRLSNAHAPLSPLPLGVTLDPGALHFKQGAPLLF